VEAFAAAGDADTAEGGEVAAVDEVGGGVGAVVAGDEGGELGDGDEEGAALLDVAQEGVVLEGRAGVPAGEEQGLVLAAEEVGVELVPGEADDIYLAVGGAGEEGVGVLAEDGDEGEEGADDGLPAALGGAAEPGGVAVGEGEGAGDGAVGAEAAVAEVEVALGYGEVTSGWPAGVPWAST